MMRQADRHHTTRCLLWLVVGALLSWGGLEGWGYLEAESQVQSIKIAKTATVPNLLEQFRSYRWRGWSLNTWNTALAGQPGETPALKQERLHLALALAQEDDNQLARLRRRLLDPETSPEEVQAIRTVLGKGDEEWRKNLRKDLWKDLRDDNLEVQRRWRVACVLALLDADNPAWEKVAPEGVQWLLREPDLRGAEWQAHLRPVKGFLLASLEDHFRTGADLELRATAARVLADYVDRPEGLLLLLLDSNPRQCHHLLAPIKEKRNDLLPLLREELARKPADKATTEEQDALASRQANAALALLHLGQEGDVWPLLSRTSPPGLRCYLFNRFAAHEIPASRLVKRLREKNLGIAERQALLLGLAEYSFKEAAGDDRTFVLQWCRDSYQDDPDAGIHGAAELLLRRWQPQTKDPLPNIPTTPEDQPLPAGKNWYVNKQEQTLTLIPKPTGPFQMGTPEGEKDRWVTETQHWVLIPRGYAIGTKEVTRKDFYRFLNDLGTPPIVKLRYEQRMRASGLLAQVSPDDDCPVIGPEWPTACAYCNWLSKKNGIPEAEWCYEIEGSLFGERGFKAAGVLPMQNNPLMAAALAVKAANEGLVKLRPGFLKKKGYRLPTEAEWEYACRAGTTTNRFFGPSSQLLSKYAWTTANSNDRTYPAGSLKPNDWGLFDVYGNVWEWCLGQGEKGYPAADRDNPRLDDEEQLPPPGSRQRPPDGRLDIFSEFPYQLAIKGGSFQNPARSARSAARAAAFPYAGVQWIGFRVARTTDP
jgi:formylglycine-generating enzyme required for sulfatase activity